MKKILWLALLFNIKAVAQNAMTDFNVSFKGAISSPIKIAVQADNKVIMGGEINSAGATTVFGLVRLNFDGSVDPTFNKDLRLPGFINDILIQDDGKILIVGQSLSERGDVIRLDANGQYDPSFVLDESVKNSLGIRIGRQSDGKYVVAAQNNSNFFRLNADGSKDPGFNAGSGINSIGIDDFDLEIQSDDKILIVGSFTTFDEKELKHIVRLNADGSLDTGFNAGTSAANTDGSSAVKAVSLQSNGKIIITGRFDSFNGTEVKGIVRLNPDGSIDDTFLLPGPAVNTFSSGIGAMAVLNDDHIALSGININGYDISYRVIVLTPDGALKPAFSMSTYVVPRNVGSIYDPEIAVTLSREIILAGSVESVNGTSRLGAAATDFDGNVLAFDPKLGGMAEIKVIERQADGQLLVGGNFLGVNNYLVKNLVRISETGDVDATFVENIGTSTDREINSIEVQSDGKILIGGGFETFNTSAKRILARLNADGTLDDTFTAQISLIHINQGVTQIYEQAEGKIVIAGSFRSNDEPLVYNFARLNADGSIDNTFNTTNFLGQYDEVLSMKFQSDGKVLVGGEKRVDTRGGFLYRTDVDGTVDGSFAHGLDLSNTAIINIEVMANDQILFSSNFSASYPNEPTKFYQLTKDGALLDNLSLGHTNGVANDFLLLENDQVLFVGGFSQINGASRSGIAISSLTGSVSAFDPKLAFNSNFGGAAINTVLRLNNESFLIGGRFTQIRNQRSFSGLAKISLTNQIPAITGIASEIVINEDSAITLSLGNISITDDNYYPDDFSLSAGSGDHYKVEGSSFVIPDENFSGNLSVPVVVNDGLADSPVFNVTITVAPVNDVPLITGVKPEFNTNAKQETPFDISLADLIVSDPDNVYPDDFSLTIAESESYELAGFTVTPKAGVTGPVDIQLSVSDGIVASEPFVFQIVVSTINGLEENLNSFTLFPNPADGILQLQKNGNYNKAQDMTITILDLSGKVMVSKSKFNSQDVHLNIEELKKGVYIIKVENSGKSWHQRFMKN